MRILLIAMPDASPKPIDLQKAMAQIESSMRAGKTAEVEALCGQVLLSRPNFPPVLFFLGLAALKRGDAETALHHLRSVAQNEPRAVQAVEWLVSLLRDRGEYTEATHWATHMIQTAPEFAGGHAALGLCFLGQSRLIEAQSCLQRAVSLAPDQANYHLNLGQALEGLVRLDEALEQYRVAIRLLPGVANQHEALGKLLIRLQRVDEGIQELQTALDLTQSPTIALHLALAFANTERFEEAEPYFAKAVDIEPTFHRALELWGGNLQILGRFDEASRIYRRAIEVAPGRPGPYLSLFGMAKVTANDLPLVDRLERMLEEPGRSKDDQRQLNYAIAKAMADLGKTEEAMKRYDVANSLSFATLLHGQPFERRNHPEWISRQIHTFTPDFFRRNQSVGMDTEAPVFIVGMIRSGTTLTEQILSSHPRMAAAGELEFWTDAPRTELLRKLMEGELAAPDLSPAAATYLKSLMRIANGQPKVTDKMPFNYLALGLIHLFFPKAKFIHCRRDPIDTCLSIYMTPFAKGAEFCYRRKSIVTAYQQYLRIMDHWRSVIPADLMLEVDYEAIIADQKAATRQMVAFCGLDWDDACLHHETNPRSVQTPSVWQVRQPIYHTSVAKWKRYEPWLREFNELRVTGSSLR